MIGRYAVKRELGRGGMGVVYLAHDAELERDVAIKTLPGVDESNPDRLRRFEREAKVLAAINHPNIATIFSIEQTDDGLRFIVLEYIEGETLGRILKKNAANLRRSIELCVQVAKAIAAAHAKGVVHRDIKPGNVMVTPDMTAKVLDFGLSMRESTGAADIDITRTVQTMPGQVMGTPGYMSPEQARGKPVDKRADIWSFGCILFHALAGQPAFHGETSTDVIAATLHHDPDWNLLPVNTPRNVRDLLQRLLVKKAEDRLDDMAVAIEVLSDSVHRFSTSGTATAAQYGNYEAVKELHSGPHATIWEVRPAGEKEDSDADGGLSRRYVAKIIEPPSVNLAPDQTMRMLDTFRSGTAVQNKVAGAPETRHWAPVYDHGQFPGGAYYVTDHIEYTASDLIATTARRTADELHSIVHGIVEGLRELDRLMQRSHGNLKPANILLRKDQPNASEEDDRWLVLLTDPASDSELESSGKKTEDDLRELGKLLYRLVQGDEWRGRAGAEMPLTNAWKQLGRNGTRWHALCSELLSETPPSLAEVAARLEQLQPRARAMPAKPLIAAAAVVVLAVGAWAAMTIFSPATDPAVQPNDSQVAIDELSVDPTPPPPDQPPTVEPGSGPGPEPEDELSRKRAQYQAMWTNWGRDILQLPVSELREVAADLGAGDSFDQAVTLVQWLADEQTMETEEDLDDAIRGLNGLRDEFKQLLGQLDDLRYEYVRLRGWRRAGDDLRERIQRVEHALDATVPVDEPAQSIAADLRFLRDVVVDSDAVVQRSVALEEQVSQIQQWMEEHNETDEPVLAQLPTTINRVLSTQELRNLHTELIDWHNVVRQVHEALDQWPRLDTVHLRENNEVYRRIDRPTGLGRGDFARWAEDVAGDRHIQLTAQDDPRLDPDWQQTVNEWSEQLQQEKNLWADVCHDRDRPDADDFTDRLQQLTAIEWDNSHRQRDRIKQLQDELERLFEREHMTWRSEVLACAGECEEQLRLALGRPLPDVPEQAEAFIDPLVRDEWRRVQDEAATGDCHELRDTATHIRRFVEASSDRLIAPSWRPEIDDLPPDIRRDDVVDVMNEKWRTLTASAFDLLNDIDWQVGIARDDSFWAELSRQQEDYSQWQRQVQQFLPDLRDMGQWLDRAYGWSDIEEAYARWRDTQVHRDFAELAGVSEIIEQVQRLERFAQQPPIASRGDAQELVAAIADEQLSRAYRFSAWQKLSEAADRQFPDYLDMEERVATHMESMFRSLGTIDRVRAGELRNQWRDGRQSRWIAYVEAASDRQHLLDAFDRMDEFHVVSEVIDDAEQFPPRLRFNLEVHELLTMAAAHDATAEQEPQSREAIQNQAKRVLEWLDRVDGPSAEHAEWRDILVEVAGFDIDADEDHGPNWDEIGPAQFGWIPELVQDGEIVRYRPPQQLIAQQGGMIRELMGDDPVITFRRVTPNEGDDDAATYLSTAEVSAGLFIALARQARMEHLLRRELLGDRFRGAQLWRWRGSEMELAGDIWLPLQRVVQDDLPAPSPRFPIQQVTPAAAVAVAAQLGCRLPTEAEWRAAVRDVVSRDGAIAANMQGPRIEGLIERTADHNRDQPMNRVDMPDAAASTEILSSELAEQREQEARDALFRSVQPNERGWFQPVETGEDAFQYLLGNVAEFVFADTLDLDVLVDLPDPKEQPGAFVERLRHLAVGEDGEANVRIIGGSIFSKHGEHAMTRSVPYAVRRRLESHINQLTYPDVGFRLAFAGTAQISPEQQFRRLVNQVLDNERHEPFLLAGRR